MAAALASAAAAAARVLGFGRGTVRGGADEARRREGGMG